MSTEVKPSAHKSNVAKKAKFLACLSAGKSVSGAAKAAAINRRTAYDWRDQDAEFRQAWEDAIEEAVETLEDEVRRRALDPKDSRSYLLLMFLLKKFRPEYRDNYKKEVTIKHEKALEFDFTAEDIKEAQEILKQAEAEAQAHASTPATEDDA